MEIEEIKAVMKLMSEFNVSEFKIEAEGCNLSIVRGCAAAAPTIAAAQVQTAVMPAVTAAPAAAEPAAAPEKSAKAPETINAPLVGTFYRSASPDAKSFVSVGDKVTADTVICIIEAMKVMNEIKAEKTGIIKEVLVGNGQPVEYAQPLFTIE